MRPGGARRGRANGARLERRKAAGLALAATGAAVGAFFRDPDRAPGDGIVLAAADGVVSAIEHDADGRVRIATFMRLQDVHVNRAPVPGVVREQRHHAGGYKPAFRKDSDANERMEWTIDTDLGEVRLVQIAGLMARRIVPYSRPGDRVERGQRIGMIRFGSRVDVTLPPGFASGVRARTARPRRPHPARPRVSPARRSSLRSGNGQQHTSTPGRAWRR